MTPESIRRHHIVRVVTFWVAVVCMVARVVVQSPDAVWALRYVAIGCAVVWLASYAMEWGARRQTAKQLATDER